ERLQDRLVLIVAARGTQRQEGLAVLEHDARRESVAGPRAWTELRGAIFVQPELLPADAHPDTGVPQNYGARNPAATRRGVEYVPVLIDDRDVSGVLHDSVRYLSNVYRLRRSRRAGEVGGPVFPFFDFGIERQRISGLERSGRPLEIYQL